MAPLAAQATKQLTFASAIYEHTTSFYLYEHWEKTSIPLYVPYRCSYFCTLLNNPAKHGGHEFFLFAPCNQIQVLHGFSREKTFNKKAEQMRVSPLHHINTLLQYPQLLFFSQFQSLHQWQYISLLLLEVLFAMFLSAQWNNSNYSRYTQSSRHLIQKRDTREKSHTDTDTHYNSLSSPVALIKPRKLWQ